MRRTLAVTLCILSMAVGLAAPASAKRVALVIGNDDYAQVAKLQKAVNDARAIGATLGALGFDVLRAENVSRREMNRQLQLFASQLETGDEALFFFAGHGVEIAGRNYLLPVDIPNVEPGQDDFVTAEAIAVDQVLQRIRSRGTRVAILMLDACRNNPFPRDGTRGVGATRGLGRLEAPEGAFVLYSAGVGQTALDRLSNSDANPNSVFTRSLIPLLRQPGLSLTQTARRVRVEVQKLATTVSHDQRPAYYDEVTGDFYFSGAGSAEQPVAQPSTSAGADERAWAVIQNTQSEAVLETFAARFPDSLYTEFAKARLNELQGEPEEDRVAVGVYPEQPSATDLQAGDEFQDCDECPLMVVVPAGSFLMGLARSEYLGPRHRVTLGSSFAVGKFEVTFAEWDACVADGGCRTVDDEGWGRGRLPVINVSWNVRIRAYLVWLSSKTGEEYRLLTEAEWEYAARAGTREAHWWGPSPSYEYANYGKEQNLCCEGLASGRDQWLNTAPVGSFPANPFGLHDMNGNVSEFVEDCWTEGYSDAPSDGSARTDGDCDWRMSRGGNFDNNGKSLSNSGRRRAGADYNSFGSIGFRVARSLEP